MSADYSVEIAPLFDKARNWDKLAENRLAEMLMPELRRIASVYLGRDFRGDSIGTGYLVSEIYVSEPISEGLSTTARISRLLWPLRCITT